MQPQRITTSRARTLNNAHPRWVMVGLEWDGPGVLLLASDKLSHAQLDFEARQYDFVNMADMLANFRPSLALALRIETTGPGKDQNSYYLIAAANWAEAIHALLGDWSPDQAVVELGGNVPAIEGDVPCTR